MSEEEQNDIKALQAEADQNATAIKTSLDAVRGHVQELEDIKEEVKSKRLAVAQISTNAETRNTQIETIHQTITTLQTQAKEIVEKIQAENTKLTTYMTSFEELRTKLDDEEEGLAAINEWATQQKEEIGSLLGKARVDQAEIEKTKETASGDADSIATHKKDVEGYRTEIEKIYGYINGQGLAHSFSERQSQLKWPLIIWSVVLFVSSLLVSWALYTVFLELPVDPETGKRIFDPAALFYRLSFVSPILLIFFVALRQYSRERRLLESYAFKAATAKALESYTEILAGRFPEDVYRNRILAFVLHAMVGIYRHPNNELGKVEDEEDGEMAKILVDLKKIPDAAVRGIEAVKDVVKPPSKSV